MWRWKSGKSRNPPVSLDDAILESERLHISSVTQVEFMLNLAQYFIVDLASVP